MKHFTDYNDYMRHRKGEAAVIPGRNGVPCGDELIIEENTIYEIDSTCLRCLQKKSEEEASR